VRRAPPRQVGGRPSASPITAVRRKQRVRRRRSLSCAER
jgi:hypothetical protein